MMMKNEIIVMLFTMCITTLLIMNMGIMRDFMEVITKLSDYGILSVIISMIIFILINKHKYSDIASMAIPATAHGIKSYIINKLINLDVNNLVN